MKNYRYGIFNASDYCITWISVVFLLLFSVASLILDLSFFFVAVPIAYDLILLWKILIPHTEQFVLNKNEIIVYKGKKEYLIALPTKITLVVSYADICPPFAKRISLWNQTHILKDKYAVSILRDISPERVFDTLHQCPAQQYTTSTVQTVFDDYQYIYSFVCNQSLIEKLVARKQCVVIVPQSLFSKVSIDSKKAEVYIDAKG